MHEAAIIAVAFGITFVAELPDKSLLAALVLGTRYRSAYVWLGASAAFAVHVVLAVAVGGALGMLPQQWVDGVVAALFLVGALWVLRSARYEDDEPGPDASRQGAPDPGLLRVAGTGFAVVFLGEWGDVTQLTTANLAARYDDPVAVAVGAGLGLWAITALAVTAGVKVLDRVPARPLRLVTAAVLAGLAVYSTAQAILGAGVS